MEPIKEFDLDRYREQTSLGDKNYTDWHSSNTIIFGSLLEDGFDWGENEWTSYSMDEENLELIRNRINSKIEDRFFFRELGCLPPARFKKFLVRNINEVMSELGPVYNKTISGIDIFNNTEKGKTRKINSDFPQAQLMPEQQDYATSAIEEAFENTSTKNQLEAIIMYSESFSEPDKRVLDYIEKCFSQWHNFNL